MSNKPNWSLLAKYLSGECSEEETLKVVDWIKGDPENQKLLDSMKNVWEKTEKNYEPSDIKSLWAEVAERTGISGEQEKQIIYKLPEEKQKKNIFSFILSNKHTPILRYAAVFLMMVAIPVMYFLFSNQLKEDETIEWTTVTVENSELYNLALDDGTKLILDSGSKLQIHENYGTDTREVKLDGEAYFEVASIPNNPFKVYSANAVVEVLGTKFNVRAWEETGKVKVAVTEGRVYFGSEETLDKKVVLNKGFGGSLSKEGELTEPEQIDVNKYLSWMKGEMSFDDVPITQVLAQVERWYNVRFSVQDSTIINDRLTVSINKNSLPDVLEVLTTLTDTQYEMKNDVITLMTATSNEEPKIN